MAVINENDRPAYMREAQEKHRRGIKGMLSELVERVGALEGLVPRSPYRSLRTGQTRPRPTTSPNSGSQNQGPPDDRRSAA